MTSPIAHGASLRLPSICRRPGLALNTLARLENVILEKEARDDDSALQLAGASSSEPNDSTYPTTRDPRSEYADLIEISIRA